MQVPVRPNGLIQVLRELELGFVLQVFLLQLSNECVFNLYLFETVVVLLVSVTRCLGVLELVLFKFGDLVVELADQLHVQLRLVLELGLLVLQHRILVGVLVELLFLCGHSLVQQVTFSLLLLYLFAVLVDRLLLVLVGQLSLVVLLSDVVLLNVELFPL